MTGRHVLATTPTAPRVGTIDALCGIVAGSGCRSIAVVGLAKNVGKTTVVNTLLANITCRFALTSLGLDGESRDHLTGLAKPRIEPPAGTLVATTEGSLAVSPGSLDVIETLSCVTSLGRVVVGRACGDGPLEVSGPTTLAEVQATVERLRAHGAERVLVDGAINRLGSASPRVSDGVLVATGGTVGDTLEDVLETTAATLDALGIPAVTEVTRRLVSPFVRNGARLVLFDEAGDAQPLDLDSVVGQGAAAAREIARRGARDVYLGGAVTADFVDDLVRVLPPRRALRLVVRDATVLVLPAAALARLPRRGITLEAVTSLNVLAVTVNPFRVPQPFVPAAFFAAVAAAVGDRLPVFDVVGGLARLPATAPDMPEVPPGGRKVSL